MRVVTEASLTRHAATQAVRPFGRSGSWTRYHAARQLPSTLRARTRNRVGNSFWLTMSNRARTGPPGSSRAASGSPATATTERRSPPMLWTAPARQPPPAEPEPAAAAVEAATTSPARGNKMVTKR